MYYDDPAGTKKYTRVLILIHENLTHALMLCDEGTYLIMYIIIRYKILLSDSF